MPGTRLIHFAARAGDHNDRAMEASPALAAELASRLGTKPVVVGAPSSAQNAGWEKELDAARPTLAAMGQQVDSCLAAGTYPIIALSRCSVSLATLPAVAKHRPDAVVVWFDAHADINTPSNSETGYLGGMALSGPLGLWDSGLGRGLKCGHAILAGTRDIDSTEWPVIQDGTVSLVPPGPDFASRLSKEIGGRPVFVHIDCDVLSPGQLPTDYSVPNGLMLEELHEAAKAIAAGGEVVGIEIGELESESTAEGTRGKAKLLVDTLAPLLAPQKDSCAPAHDDHYHMALIAEAYLGDDATRNVGPDLGAPQLLSDM